MSQDGHDNPTQNPLDREEHAAQDPRFAADYASVAEEVSAYRAAVLERLEPSVSYEARLQRMLVELVREDVHREFRKTSPRARVTRWAIGWAATWRELTTGSPLFRMANRGAVALGAGLFMACLWDIAQDESLADTVRREREMVPEAPLTAPAVLPDPGDAASSKLRSERLPRKDAGRRLAPRPR